MSKLFSAIVERDAFLAALTKALNFVEKRSTIPILGNVLIRASAAGLTITATDPDVELTVPVESSELGRDSVTVNAHVLHKLFKALPSGAVTLGYDEEGARFTATAGRSNFALQTMDPQDFPAMEICTPFSVFTLPAATLRTMVKKVDFAISTEETRYYLNGIFLTVQGGKLLTVATDGHRLGEWSEPLPVGADIPAEGVIIPRNTVAGLLKVMNGSTDDVTVKLWKTKSGEVRIGFSTARFVLNSKSIDGSFPDWRRVIPREGAPLTVDLPELTRALATVMAIKDRGAAAVRFEIRRGAVRLTTTNPEIGSVTEEIGATWEGDPVEIGFNGFYVGDLFPLISGGTVTFWITDFGSPARVTDPADDRLLLVLMPMRV